jgi:peroxiredoxin Q/BCP
MAKLKTGAKAPAFKLKDKKGVFHSLKSFKSDFKVIYFYPKDDTPGCTIEAKEFTKDLKKFNKVNAAVVGISGGDEKTKSHFCKKFKLKVSLLSDTDFKIAKKYGCYGKKSFMGKTYFGIFRKTFLLNGRDKILKIYDKVSPDIHPQEVLSDILSFL